MFSSFGSCYPYKYENCSFFSEFLYYASGAAPETNLKKSFVTAYNCYAAYENQTIPYVGFQKKKKSQRFPFISPLSEYQCFLFVHAGDELALAGDK